MEVNNNKNFSGTNFKGTQSAALTAYLAKNANNGSDTLDLSDAAKSSAQNTAQNAAEGAKDLGKRAKIKKLVIAGLAAAGVILCVTKGKDIINGLGKKSGGNTPSPVAPPPAGPVAPAPPKGPVMSEEDRLLQEMRQKFDNFDSSRILDRVPTETELAQTANNLLATVNIKPVFDESTVTKTEITTLLEEYFSFGGYGKTSDTLAGEIMSNSSCKRIFNNFLSLVKEEKDKSTFYFKPGSYNIEDTLRETSLWLTKNEYDEIFKMYKLNNPHGSAWDMREFVSAASRDVDYAKKITALQDLTTKSVGQRSTPIFSATDVLQISTRPEISDVARFFTNLRKGNLTDTSFSFDSNFDFKKSSIFLSHLNEESIKVIKDTDLKKICEGKEMTPKQLGKRLNNLSRDQLRDLYAYQTDLNTYFKFENFVNVKNINELDQAQKRELMKKLVESNSDVFTIGHKQIPIIPKNKEEYCSLLKKLSKSIGISTKPLTALQISNFGKTLGSISDSIKNVDLDKATIQLVTSRETFVAKVKAVMDKLPEAEQNKVMDYYGFEIAEGKLKGYPINVNNGEKLKDISDAATKAVVESLRPIVEEFSGAQNKIQITGIPGAQALEKDLNDLLEALPELRSIIGRAQHKTHKYTLDIHTLRVLQEVCANPKFQSLSDSDKQVLQISALLHDIAKTEGQRDLVHPMESAFDAYYIIQKLNLPETDQLKIYELIKSHNWLDRLNNPKNKGMIENIAQDIAFDARHTNTFELAKILCEADMKSVQPGDKFFQKHQHTLQEMSDKVDSYLSRIHNTQIVLPQTKIPKASQITGGTIKSANGITNTVIYFDDVDDLVKLGFAPGTTKENFLGLVHALEQEEQIRRFDTFHVIDTDALLSTSYIQADNYRVFRNQGLILDVAPDDVHAGFWRDFGTGYGKSIELLKQDYLYRGTRKDILPQDGWRSDRTYYRDYISQRVRNRLGLNEEEYYKLLSKIKDCRSLTEIEAVDKNLAKSLLSVITSMKNEQLANVHRKIKDPITHKVVDRSYNEMLVSRPHIQGTFAYDRHYEDIPEFLRKFAQDNDLPIIIFGKPA